MTLADKGFTVEHLVNPLEAKIRTAAFLKGRKFFTAHEELESRKIAEARIHIKQFKHVGRKISLSLSPLATQLVVVACALVNFQEVLCK